MDLKWRTSGLREEDGVLVGADLTQEWLLPWWWGHYRKHNAHPVTFIDFGLSFEKKEWCRQRGELVPLRLLDDFVAQKVDPLIAHYVKEEFGPHFSECRAVWFKKPLAFLQTPYRRTIWIDLDCEVRGSITPLFAYADQPTGLGMIKDRCHTLIDYDYPIYNSGVVPYRRTLTLIVEWAQHCIERNHHFRGDQEVLSHMIAEKEISISEIPLIYNWSRVLPNPEQALIVHWHGVYGKHVIRTQINVAELCF